MARGVIQSNVQDSSSGLVIAPGATITIVDSDTGAPVAAYTARTGGSLVSPITADANGFFRVYVEPGRVNITATYNLVDQVFNDVVVFSDYTDLSRKVMTTAQGSTGAENGAGTWCKIADITPDNVNYEFWSKSLFVQDVFQLSGGSYAELKVNVSQGASSIDLALTGIDVVTAKGFSSDSFLITIDTAGLGQTLSVWMKKPFTYGQYLVEDIVGGDSYGSVNNSNFVVVWNDVAAWQSAVPSGVAATITGDWPGAWVSPTLLNSWAGTFKYRKYANGMVDVIMSLSTGTDSTPVFNMPQYFRPATQFNVPAFHTASQAEVIVQVAGNVIIDTVDNNTAIPTEVRFQYLAEV